MPRKTPSRKLILWDDLHVGLYGPPPDIPNDRAVRRCVLDLMSSFGGVVIKCMKDRARQIPTLNRFRVKVQS
jgi:hypothetical protein